VTENKWKFIHAAAIDEEQFFVAAMIDEGTFEDPAYEEDLDWENNNYENQTNIWLYSPKLAKIRGDKKPWNLFLVINWVVSSMCMFYPEENKASRLCVISGDGDVLLSKDGGIVEEKIPGVKVGNENWGEIEHVCQIGAHLYACGRFAQVYKRFGENYWHPIDKGLRQPSNSGIADDGRIEETIFLYRIDGSHEKAIYAVGQQWSESWLRMTAKAFFYNGEKWREITLPEEAGQLTDICVESESRIWLCGTRGTLLLGNAEEGFADFSCYQDDLNFFRACQYQNLLMLVSDRKNCYLDLKNPEAGIFQGETTLNPDLQDVNIIETRGNSFWSIGTSDIAYYDGKKWRRIHHPENPLIDARERSLEKNKKRKPLRLEFESAIAISDTELYVAAQLDYRPHTPYLAFCHIEPNEKWSIHEIPYSAKKITWFRDATASIDCLVTLSSDGSIAYLDTHAPMQEKIHTLELSCMEDIKQIGQYLYVAGDNGQIYQRIGAGDWRRLGAGFLSEAEGISFSEIDGVNENSLYVIGSSLSRQDEGWKGTVFFYNGSNWQEIHLPTGRRSVTALFVESESRVWITACTSLLFGNAEKGFLHLAEFETDVYRGFLKICAFQNKIYLASEHYLYTYDPQNPGQGIKQLVPDLDPPLEDIHTLTCHNQVLWSIGRYDVVRFDGNSWQRLHYPYNEDLRERLKTTSIEQQRYLAISYARAKNYAKAFLWYKKIARQGDVSAQNELGEFYLHGIGTNQDDKHAFELFKKASENKEEFGFAWANLAYMYRTGRGTEKDYGKAFYWYEKAAHRGWIPSAREELGNMYENGLGTRKDYAKARYWYEKAIEEGDTYAMMALGRFYQQGIGVKKNPAKAKSYYKMAEDRDHAGAKEALERLHEDAQSLLALSASQNTIDKVKVNAEAQHWVDALAERVGLYELGNWLAELAYWLGDVSFYEWLKSSESEGFIRVDSRARGVAFTLLAVPGYDKATPKERRELLTLDNVILDTWQVADCQSALPFNLLVKGESIESIAEKVGAISTAGGVGQAGETVCFFLGDGRVLSLTYGDEGCIGLVLISRTGKPIAGENL